MNHWKVAASSEAPSQMETRAVHHSIILLRLSCALFLFLIGLDKLLHTNIIGPWESYAGPVIHALLPFTLITVISIQGIVEIVLAVGIVTRWIRPTILLLLLTSVPVIIDLFILHYYQIALRDLIFAVAAAVLYMLYGAIRTSVSNEHIKDAYL